MEPQRIIVVLDVRQDCIQVDVRTPTGYGIIRRAGQRVRSIDISPSALMRIVDAVDSAVVSDDLKARVLKYLERAREGAVQNAMGLTDDATKQIAFSRQLEDVLAESKEID